MNYANLIRISAISMLLIACMHTPVFSQQPLPATYGSNVPVNYIRTWDATAPETNPGSLMTKALRDVKEVTQYFDGLGRPIQTVMKKGALATNSSDPLSSTEAVDMISATVYDEYGREQFKYLPFASTATDVGKNNGSFKVNPFRQQADFYNAQLSGQSGETNLGVNNLNWAYSQTFFEPSPLNKPTENFAPGASWVGTNAASEANRHSAKVKHCFNTTTDAVQKWTVTNSGSIEIFGTYASTGAYAADELYKTITTDENGKQFIQFQDKEGKIILKKMQFKSTTDNGSGSGYPDWLCTYYIYDIFNNLRCVIQPEGVKAIYSGWTLTTPVLNEQCYRYEYDEQNRMIMRKLPGVGEVYMVYDARDRMIMSQDANQRAANKWMVTLYDIMNRPEQTGVLLNTWNNNSFAQHRTTAYNSTSYPFTSSTTPSVTYWEYLSKTGYDTYSTIPVASGLNNTFDASYAGHFYNTYNTSPSYAQPQIASLNTIGMVTWSETKIIGTANSYLYVVSIYNSKGRVIQIKSTNVTGGVDIITTQHNWMGKPLITVQKLEKAQSPAQTSVIISRMTYDDLGRIVKTEKKLSNTAVAANDMSAYKTVSQLEYDKLGQVKVKKLGTDPENASQPLETLHYDYNVRGWMLGMNRSYLASQGQSGTTRFGFELGYDKLTNSASRNFQGNGEFNGNITGMIWKSDGDDVRRKYDFSYDAANRLLQGVFEQDDAITSWNSSTMNYGIKMGNGSDPEQAYDNNGNIKAMTQYGWNLGGSYNTPIDNLTYTPVSGTNRLERVVDANNDYSSKLGDFKYDPLTKTSVDYTYDANGNLTADNNKKISSITYNHLNLPAVITVAGKGTITYTYDAAGNKVRKVTQENNTSVPYNGSAYTTNITTTITYIGTSVYESKAYSHASLSSLQYTDKLQLLMHEEGRIRFEKANPATCSTTVERFVYDYYIKDHVGNVRAVLTEQKEDICYIAATVEDATYQVEDDVYNIVNGRRIDKSLTGATQASFDNKLYKVHGNQPNEKTGLGVVLKVMSGDQVKIMGESFYTMPGGGTGGTFTLGLTELLTAFVNSGAVLSSQHSGISTSDISGAGTNSTTIANFISGTNPGSNTARAYINWILLDEQFRFVAGDVDPVQQNGGYKLHTKFIDNPVNVTKNGYLYIYVSNENNLPVYFDNLNIRHSPGAILEETHYYPFGLSMNGISAKALVTGTENKYKFNGIEQNNDLDLNMYDAFFRNLDPQLGRFWQVDPKPTDMYSSYSVMQNNPVRFSDPLGDSIDVEKASLTAQFNAGGKTVTGADLAQQMVDDWMTASGLDIKLDKESGQISLGTGAAKKSGYSKSARKQIQKMLGKAGKKVTIKFIQDGDSEAKGNNMTLAVNGIQTFIDNTPKQLESMTMGYGMTALHEWFHTTPGGGFEHNSAILASKYEDRLDKPDIEVNKIRSELSAATGKSYGQRGAYTGVFWWDETGRNGHDYMPMGALSSQQFDQLKNASRKKDASLLPNVPFIIAPLPDNKYMIQDAKPKQ